MGFWLTLFMWAVSFLLTDYFRPKLPSVEPSGLGEFQSPTATEGRKIPQVLGGTVKINGPNTLWRGEWEAIPVTVETGIVFKDDETVGYEYHIALALGQFYGRTAGMTAIYLGDDIIWDYVTDNAGVPGLVADIDLPDLFGGYSKGGGFQARIRAFNGSGSQPVSSFLSARVTNQSRWPGLVYVVMTDLSETAGANIGEQNALRDIRIEWQCYNTIANGGLGNELGLTGDRHIIGRDSNPISAAYRILTDPQWSVGLGDINFTNFQEAAITCYDEGIGFSMVVDSETEAFELLSIIEKHIDGYFGPNPQNGLMEVILARSGYDPLLEYQADETNIVKVTNWAKNEWPQTKNEVKARFVNRDKNYNDDHAVAQDMAGRLISGRPQSITTRYPGVRTAAAANAIVARTARAYFWPLIKFEMELDRTAWELRPGSVVVVNYDEIGAVDMPCRVTRLRMGDPVKQTIKVDVVEDVFAYETGIQAQPQQSEDVPPTFSPVAVSNYYKVYAPRWLLDIYSLPMEARLLWVVERDNPNTGYQVRYRTRPTPFGGNFNGELVDTSVPYFTAVGTLRNAVPQLNNASSNNGGANESQGGEFYVDGALSSLAGTYSVTAYEGLAIIDPGTLNEEFIAVGSITTVTGGVYLDGVWRGVGNSPIREHAAGTPVAFIDRGAYLQELILDGDTSFGAQFKVTPIAHGTLGTTPAFDGEMAVDNRAWRKPYPPTAVIFTNLSSNWYATGELQASGPGSNLSAPSNGVPITVYNRRFDSSNAVLGANSQTPDNTFWGTNSFSDLSTTLNWFIYNLDTHPSPVRGNEILSGIVNTNNRDNVITAITQEAVQALELVAPSPINARFEFTFENGVDLQEVLTGVESESTFVDRTITYTPAPLSFGSAQNTVLLLHFEGFDGTTQVIDYSQYNHPVTLVGEAEIDTNIPADTGLQPGAMIIDGTGDYANVPDHPAFDFDCDTGFTIQCRVYIKSTPTGEQPLVTKWATTGDQRSWWLGLNDTTLRLKMSTTGADEIIETTGTRTWTIGQWYEITCTVWNPPGGAFTYVWFWVDGVFDETELATTITALHAGTAPVRIGADGEGNTFQAANIDEVRIQDIAAIRSAFTLPQEEYWGREHLNPVLLNWEKGVDGATTYVTDDLNHFPLQFPTGAGAQIDDAQFKFGTKSCYFGGINNVTFDSSSRVRIPETEWSTGDYEAWFDFGVRDFTMECWVRFEVLPSTQGTSGLITKWKRGGAPNAVGSEQFNRQNWQFLFGSSNALSFSYNINNAITTLNSDPLTLSINTWYHCAVCRKDGVLGLFFDGNRVAQDLTGFDGLWIRNHNAARVTLGGLDANSSSTSWALKGWMDEIRILNGIAAYDPLQATYTVPTAAFPVDPDPEAAPPVTGLPSNWSPLNS